MTFDEFVANTSIRNVWLEEDGMKVYVRRSSRNIDGVMIPALDLATVEVDEDRRGTKVFTKFLSRFEAAAKTMNRIVYVESILEPRLYAFLLKKGYLRVPNSADSCPCVYRIDIL